MYTVEKDFFLSSNGKNMVSYQVYIPGGTPLGIVQISHGMAEHFGRYKVFAEFLTENGFLVCGNDHLGHGETAAAFEDFGYFGEKNGWVNMVDDLNILTMRMKDQHGNLPYFLAGHSMGSLLTRAYISCYGKELSGAIIIGTSGKNSSAKTAMPLVDLIGKTKGERYRSRFLYSIAFGNYNKKYEKGSRKLAWMTRDNQVLDSFKSDPKCNFIFTVSGFRDLMKLVVYVSRQDWSAEVPKELPIILLSGDMDPVGDFGEGIRHVFKQLQLSGVKDLSLRLYPGFRHEILNEPGKEKIYQDILNWLRKHK